MSASNKTFIQRAYLFAGSFGLAIGLIFALFILTFLGTLEQSHMSLYDVQRKYFTSFFLLHRLPGGIVVPLPGVYLLMAILSVTLVIGGMIRIRRSWSLLGIYITHGGILFLMLSSLITHHYTIEGQMTLAPGETSTTFHSYNEWELAVTDISDPDHDTEYLIDAKQFAGATGGKSKTFRPGDLGFEIAVSGYARNSMPKPGGPALSTAARPVLDGFYVEEQPVEMQNEMNTPAVYVAIRDLESGAETHEILWGRSIYPLVYVHGGQEYLIDLRHQNWEVPFSITLTKFIHDKHPGMGMASNFESRVIKTEDGIEQDIAIRMNEPLRHLGYTFFQSSFSEDPRTGITSSTFAVVKNPADQFPLYAMIAVTFGMVFHFGQMLLRHLKTQRGTRAS